MHHVLLCVWLAVVMVKVTQELVKIVQTQSASRPAALSTLMPARE